jgi:hypothetical protein
MRSLIAKSLIVFSAFGLAACGETVDGPPASEIESALKIDMPTGVEVTSVKLEAAENVGSEIEPRYRSRSKVELRLTEDYYERVGSVDGKPLVKKTAERGDTISGVLITQSEPAGDNDWKVDIERLQVPPTRGQAESSFGDEVIEENSDAHKEAIEAEKTKQADEERKAKEEQEASRRAFIGTWTSSQPTLRRDVVYTANDRQMGIKLNLAAPSGDVGTGTATFYTYGNETESVPVPISYVIDKSGDFARITFTERATHQGLSLSIYKDSTWYLREDGTFTDSRSGRGTWVSQLSKS